MNETVKPRYIAGAISPLGPNRLNEKLVAYLTSAGFEVLTWRSLAAVPILEEDFGKPVVTNPIAQVWRLISQGVAPPVQGWGRLLANDAARR